MGLENLQSVFNDLGENINSPVEGRHGDSSHPDDHSGLDDLSKNTNSLVEGRHGGFSHLEDHSALDDIEKNLISDPNPRVGMLHGILTEGDVFVFALPNPPDKKPLTGRDTSEHNDILKHSTIDPKSGLYSIVSDKLEDFDSFTTLPYPEIDSEFANKSIRLIGGESLIDTEIEHTFGFTIYDDLITQPIPIKRDENSQLSNEDENITFNSFINAKVIGPQLGYSQNEAADTNNPTFISIDKKQQRAGYLFQELGENNQLGVDPKDGGLGLNWTALYEPEHKAIVHPESITIRRADPSKWWDTGLEIKPNRGGEGDRSTLDIMKYRSGLLDNFRGFDRGAEPYVVKPIGSTDYSTLVDRDMLPFNRAKDDASRLLQFYTSKAGIAFMVKENITGAVTSAVLTIAPTGIWDGYKGKDEYNNIGIGTGVLTKAAHKANMNRLLKMNLFLPPLPIPMTGLLNVYHNSVQEPGTFNIRKPGAHWLHYSKLVNSSNDNAGNTFSRIRQLGKDKIVHHKKYKGVPNDKDTRNRTPGLKKLASGNDQGNYNQFQTFDVTKESPVSDTISAGEDKTITPTNQKFLKLADGNDDYIAKSKVIDVWDVATKITANEAANGTDFAVRIKCERDKKYIYFRGYVTGITENVTPAWSSMNYLGRSEPVYRYQRAERDLSFNLRLYPNNSAELQAMYEKINYLTGLCYPQYAGPNPRFRPSFTELHIAHIGKGGTNQGQFGFIKSLSYTVNDSGDWDADTKLPRLIDVAISYQIVNKKAPRTNNTFYDVDDRILNTYPSLKSE